jgi:hypothetical protein
LEVRVVISRKHGIELLYPLGKSSGGEVLVTTLEVARVTVLDVHHAGVAAVTRGVYNLAVPLSKLHLVGCVPLWSYLVTHQLKNLILKLVGIKLGFLNGLGNFPTASRLLSSS